ncbi:MAG TPA: sigma 54-interacting transcriptional regulator [Firmicutes bacterium]|jgi:propionate catabolism operon transcriptional regulator|nr:sigma 54-interacting transcriptional regulator [Bacillota bacterium]
MRPTIAFISYPRLTKYFLELNPKIPENVNLEIMDLVLEEALEKALLLEQQGAADVFIASGGNAKLLSGQLASQLVEIKITGFDLLQALKSVARFSRRAAIVTCMQRFSAIEEIKQVLALDVVEISYEHPEEVDIILEKLGRKGIVDIVGGSLVVERAEEKGMRGHLIYSEEGITYALETAAQLAISERTHAEHTQAMQAIFDFAHSGILVVNQDNIITMLNDNASKITQIPKDQALGHPFSTFSPKTKLSTVLTTGKPAVDQVERIGIRDVLVNWAPLIVKNKIIGAVGTFQSIGAVQASEKKIRINLHLKGLLAKNKLDDILGESQALQRAKDQAQLYAASQSNVLILGASGTGKELFAQGIHNASPRNNGPFVAVNCAALPENLLESELFGYEEGAFTGARKGGKTGLFELAHGGSIFLDEIGELPLALQARLLRVLEEKEVMRLGGESIIPVDIRVIAATNRDLRQLVQEGNFREDLFYRLNVLVLKLPTLQEGKEDIPILLSHFLNEMGFGPEPAFLETLLCNPQFKDYNWPGNIRELRNFAERLTTLYSLAKNVDELVSLSLVEGAPQPNNDHERILTVLEEVGGNKTKAAERLGISRTTLWRRLKEIDM